MSSGTLYREAVVRTDVLQGKETLESSQLIARIFLTTDGQESLLHGIPTVKSICYRGVVD
jgi:hypothetical protein